MQLIVSEGAELAVIAGDMDYGDDPAAWDAYLDTYLGVNFPVVASVGNHDDGIWTTVGGYAEKLQARDDRIADLSCTGTVGVMQACNYKGLFVLLSGAGTLGSDADNVRLPHQPVGRRRVGVERLLVAPQHHRDDGRHPGHRTRLRALRGLPAGRGDDRQRPRTHLPPHSDPHRHHHPDGRSRLARPRQRPPRRGIHVRDRLGARRKKHPPTTGSLLPDHLPVRLQRRVGQHLRV